MADRPNGIRVVLPSSETEPKPPAWLYATMTPSTKMAARALSVPQLAVRQALNAFHACLEAIA
jgi:hypothetical protein